MKFEMLVDQIVGEPSLEKDIGETTLRNDYDVEYLGSNQAVISSESYVEIANVAERLKGHKLSRGDDNITPYRLNARVKERRFWLYTMSHIVSLCMLLIAYNVLNVTLPVEQKYAELIKTTICIFVSLMPWVLVLFINSSKPRIVGMFVTKLINDELRLIRVAGDRQRWRVVGPSGLVKLDFTLYNDQVLIHRNTLFNIIIDPYEIVRQLLAHHIVDRFETKFK